MTTLRLPQLATLGLRIGQTVQVIRYTLLPSRHYTQLIGFVEHEFIMLRVPRTDGWPVHFNAGERLTVRSFSGTSLHEFDSHLIALLHHPRNYMTLGSPGSVRTTPLRSHERVRCTLPVRILNDTVSQARPGGYSLYDLSGSGAAMVGQHALGGVGDALQIEAAFALGATNTEETVVLDAVIRSVRTLPEPSSEATGFLHGIRFERVEPRILLLTHELSHRGRAHGRPALDGCAV